MAVSARTLSCFYLYRPSPSALGHPVKTRFRVQKGAPHCLQDESLSLPQIFRLFGVGKRSATARRRKVNLLWSVPQSLFQDSNRSSAWSHYHCHCPWQVSPTAFTRCSSSAASRALCTTSPLLPLASPRSISCLCSLQVLAVLYRPP